MTKTVRSLICLAVVVAQIHIGFAVAAQGRSIDAEASLEAAKVWQKRVAHCGGSYYRKTYIGDDKQTRRLIGFTELKDFNWHLESLPLSNADRLNGVEYRERTFYSISAYRDAEPAGDWHPWVNGYVSDEKTTLTLVNGAWQIEEPYPQRQTEAPTCQEAATRLDAQPAIDNRPILKPRDTTTSSLGNHDRPGNTESSLEHYNRAESLFEQRNYPAAMNEYQKAIQGNGDPRWTEVWSHIGIGKIYDLGGLRSNAQNEYRQAVQTGDPARGALEEARKYLETPFQLKSSDSIGSTTQGGTSNQQNTEHRVTAQSGLPRSGIGPAPFTISDVIQLSKAGVAESVIIQKIRTCNCRLDTSTQAIIQLQQVGVSAAVMNAMMGDSNPPTSNAITSNKLYEKEPDLNSPYYTSKNPFYPKFGGQCTWFAWGRAHEKGFLLPLKHNDGKYGNAADWTGNLSLPSGSQPRPDSLAVWQGPSRLGHVAYIEDVSDGYIFLREANIKPCYVDASRGGGYCGGLKKEPIAWLNSRGFGHLTFPLFNPRLILEYWNVAARKYSSLVSKWRDTRVDLISTLLPIS